jgi:hypothetical protein
MTGFQSKRRASEDKFYNLISEEQIRILMIEAVQELTEQVELLTKRIESLESKRDGS